ncbi:MAG: hypothetical protein JO051_02130 [Acidobacteriaceae bacterium]|nr:hypothetical protein [Acidobacteriaceae bacterium]
MGAVAQKLASAGQSEVKRQLVERVAQSDLFQKSPRLREFLVYVAACTLENRLAEVREQVIAERVFGRKPDAGGEDTIVRAEARNLRKRLDLYFHTEGRDEPMIIVMPKGGYALDFPLRGPELAAEAEQEAPRETNIQRVEAPVKTAELEPAPLRGSDFYRQLSVVLAIAALLASGLAGYWYVRDATVRKRLEIGPLTFPFSALFNDSRDTLVVTSDTGLLQISSLLHRRVTLDEYIARSYPGVPDTNPPDLARNWNIYEFTDGREMAIAGLVLRHNSQFAPRTLFRSGHAVQLQDFKDHNAILIGSPISNPWAQLFEDKLNFRCDLAADGRIVFRSKSPRRNESNQYPNEDDIQNHRTYARVVFLPKSSDAGSALLIAGTTAQSTQAAGELLVDQARLASRLSAMNMDPFGQPRFFEVLIRSTNFVGGAIMSEVVAWRTSTAPER